MKKKIISVLLATILIFSAMAPAASAVGEAKPIYPVVYVTGYGPNIFAVKGDMTSEIYWPTSEDLGAILKEAIGPCLKELAVALVTDDFSKYCDELYKAIHPIYEDISLAPDGMPKDASGRGENPNHIFLMYDKYTGGDETFPYDWRLSPEYSAAELSTFVDTMIRETGAPKVNIVARCLGGNVLSAYLQNDPNAVNKVETAVFYIPSTEGIGLFGQLFSGKLDITADNLNTYVEELVKYQALVDDPAVQDFLVVLISILEQIKFLSLAESAFEKLIDEIGSNLIPRIIRRSYGSFPSFWSMVPAEDLETAIEYVYNTPELKEEYAGTIEKARHYRDYVQLNARKNIQELSDKIDIKVISKYNIPLMPIIPDCDKNSDGTAETIYTSFGATVSDFGKTLTADYIASMPEANKKYLSADEQIDASTCALPNETWFIKNSYHDHFPASIDKLIDTMLLTDMDIFSNPEYPQFLEDTGAEKLVPVTEKDEVRPDDNSFEGIIALFKRFIASMIEIFKKLFNSVPQNAA